MPEDLNKKLEEIRQRQIEKDRAVKNAGQRAREDEAKRAEMERTVVQRWNDTLIPMIVEIENEINHSLEGASIKLRMRPGSPVKPQIGLMQLHLLMNGMETGKYITITSSPVGTIRITPGDKVTVRRSVTEIEEPYRDLLKAALVEFLDAVT